LRRGVSVQGVDQKPDFLMLHERTSIACGRFSAAREVFLYEKPGFLPPSSSLTLRETQLVLQHGLTVGGKPLREHL